MAKKAKKAAKKTAKKTAKKKTARKPNAAFMKPMTPSPALAEVVGSKPIPRTEVTKKLWAYIKKNKLQDPKNKRMIKADAAAEGGVRRQGAGQHVRDDQAGQQAPEVVPRVRLSWAPTRGAKAAAGPVCTGFSHAVSPVRVKSRAKAAPSCSRPAPGLTPARIEAMKPRSRL